MASSDTPGLCPTSRAVRDSAGQFHDQVEQGHRAGRVGPRLEGHRRGAAQLPRHPVPGLPGPAGDRADHGLGQVPWSRSQRPISGASRRPRLASGRSWSGTSGQADLACRSRIRRRVACHSATRSACRDVAAGPVQQPAGHLDDLGRGGTSPPVARPGRPARPRRAAVQVGQSSSQPTGRGHLAHETRRPGFQPSKRGGSACDRSCPPGIDRFQQVSTPDRLADLDRLGRVGRARGPASSARAGRVLGALLAAGGPIDKYRSPTTTPTARG